MKRMPFAILIILFFATISSSIEGQTKKNKLENPFENNGDLNSQLDYLFKTSTNYKEYKVISRKGYSKIHKNILDSIAFNKKTLTAQRVENKNKLSEINKLKTKLKGVSEELQITSSNKNSIPVFGINIYKTNYNLIVVILLISFLSLAAFFFYKYTNSNVTTKEAQKQLEDAQQELEAVQKNALQRQQELNRKLQDQILKNGKK
tara:strand:- start:1556 stop:2170 length:615 start_codon:yes stop_codon:yes gene_type:complete